MANDPAASSTPIAHQWLSPTDADVMGFLSAEYVLYANTPMQGATKYHVHVEVAIKDAFAAARRQIEAVAQRASGKVKLHEVEAHGRVSKISAAGDHGFIATPDGGEIYFHRNSVASGGFDKLTVGDEVRFVAQHSESAEGPQASTVVPLGKHHLPPAESVRT